MDAIRDIKIIKNELIMKDRDILSKKLNEYEKKAAKTQDKNIKAEYEVLKKVDDAFKKGMEIRNLQWDPAEIEILNKYLFLTSKPMIYLINTSKELFLQDKIPNFDSIVDLVTENGKFQTQVIKYSVEHEQNIEKG
jgi:obg-like ATPase 1